MGLGPYLFEPLQVLPMPYKAILIIILLIIIAIFAAENLEFVEVGYYDLTFTPKKVEIPLCFVMLAPLLLGFLFGWFFGWLGKLKLRGVIRRNEKMILSLNEELERHKKPALPEFKESGQ